MIVMLCVKRKQRGSRVKRRFSPEILQLKGRCVNYRRMQYLNNRYGENIQTFTGSIEPIIFYIVITLSTGESLIFLVVIQVWQTTIKRRMSNKY